MSFVADFVGDAIGWVGDTIGNVVETVGDTIKGALKDPLGTIAQIAAVATGNAWAIPLINGANTAIHGGDLGDVFKSVAISAIAQKVAPMVGEKVQGALGTTLGKTTANIIASGAASSAVAVVTGQDPLKAFLSGGISAGTSAIVSKLEQNAPGSWNNLSDSSKSVIKAAVEAQLSGGNVGAAVIGTVLRTSEYVTKTLNDLGVAGKDSTLTPQNQAILSDILYNTATAAMTGSNASNVVQAALMKAGSKALGEMASNQFDKVTGRVVEVYNNMTGQVELIKTNEASQKKIAADAAATQRDMQFVADSLEKYKTEANARIDAFNADRSSQEKLDAANQAIDDYNSLIANANERYTNEFKPQLDLYQAQMDAVQKEHTQLTDVFDKLNLSFSDATGNLDLVTDKTSKVVSQAMATEMDPNFNAAEYAAINGLDSSVDPATHWLTEGKNKGLYTNNLAASTDIDAKHADLIQAVAKSYGLDPAQLTSKDFVALDKMITDRYGNNLSALSTAKASDITGKLTKEQLFTDSAASGFKGDANAVVYGDWNKPASLELPPGVKLASKEDYIAGITKQGVDANGKIYSYVPNPDTGPKIWSNADGSMGIKLDTIYMTDGSKGVSSAIQRAFTLADFPDAARKVDQIAIDAAKNLVNKAKETGNYNSITDKTLDAATKAQTLKQDISTIFDYNTTTGVTPEGPNTALFGGTPGAGGAGAPVTTLGPISNKYSLLGYGGTFYVKDLTNDRVYTVLNVGNSTILKDAATNIEVTLTPDQAKVLKGQIAGGMAGNLDVAPGATDVAKLAEGLSSSNGKTVAENTAAINNQIAAGTTSLEDAKAMLVAAGFTNPTDAEAQQFVSIRNPDATSKTAIETYADPLVTTKEEVNDFFVQLGYKASEAELAKFIGKIAESKSKTDVGTYTDPLMVDSTEVKDAFKAMGITNPDPADVDKFVGQYNESVLQSKIDPLKSDIQFRSLQYQLNNGTLGGGTSSAAVGSRYANPTAADATAIQNIIASGTGGTGATDLKYDYNGDGKVDNTDLSAIQGYLGGTGGTGGTGVGTGGVGGGTNTGIGTGFTPGAGTIWDAPTGVYKTVVDEAEATRAAQAAEAEKARVAAEANRIAISTQADQNQKVANTGQLVNWLAQAGDASGQKVTVNQSPLTQINNVYDWSSIFGTPQQEKMFITPYAEGGSVEDLMKILKG